VIFLTLKKDVSVSCKISVYFYQTTRHHIPEDSNIHFIVDTSKPQYKNFGIFKGILVEFITKMSSLKSHSKVWVLLPSAENSFKFTLQAELG
jgi:hypothetical protein